MLKKRDTSREGREGHLLLGKHNPPLRGGLQLCNQLI
jgi:hypothetical protein